MPVDAVLYRSKLVPTVLRRADNHGHVTEWKAQYSISMVKPGDVVSRKEKARNIPAVLDAIVSVEREVPEYIDVIIKIYGNICKSTRLEEVSYPVQMEPNLVVEYYSR